MVGQSFFYIFSSLVQSFCCFGDPSSVAGSRCSPQRERAHLKGNNRHRVCVILRRTMIDETPTITPGGGGIEGDPGFVQQIEGHAGG